jgi:DNA-binding NarL/FixJ family response regulator
MFKVIVADNHDLFRAGIVKLLSNNEDFRLIAQFSEWAKFLTAAATNRESLIIVSTFLIPELAYLVDRTREVRSRVLLIAEDFDSANRYRSSGVAGVVHRSTSTSAFLDCLLKIRRGSEFVSPSAAVSEQDTVGARSAERLTTSELKMVALLMQGMRYKQIGDRLEIVEKLVRNRFQKVFDKTGVSNRLELAIFISNHRAFASAAAAAFEIMEGGRPPSTACQAPLHTFLSVPN